jgi:hypothetical protein
MSLVTEVACRIKVVISTLSCPARTGGPKMLAELCSAQENMSVSEHAKLTAVSGQLQIYL